MKPINILTFTCSLLIAFSSRGAETKLANSITVSGDCQSPRVEFAVGDLKTACAGIQPAAGGVAVTFTEDKSLGAQAYRIGVTAPGKFTVSGGDTLGLMYGGLQLAERIRFDRGIGRIRAESGSPYLPYRGLKMNIPLDARTPSYDDSGDSALWNIVTMWDFSFWQAQLDEMARHRYNALSLWNPHPFPALIKLKDYPDIALKDVCTSSYKYPVGEHSRSASPEILKNLVVLKTMTMDEKIAFWRKVMAYAKDRGIEMYFITWNVQLDGASGKYGITSAPNNTKTIDYLRASVRELFTTYPDLAGIGTTAGEVMRAFPNNVAKEKWLWQTYGLGVKDAVASQPGRQIRFIHREWQTDLGAIQQEFKDFPGPLDSEFKYTGARIHSMPNPNYADGFIKDLQSHHMKSWWNLRNDDLFCLRWGDPDYVRSMIKNMPHEETAGFHMGSDGYVWARNFALLDESKRGEMEISRHWYNFMLWGRLGYDPSLDRCFFESALLAHFPEVDAPRLYDAWTASSKIMPQINRFYFQKGDWMFLPEACQGRHAAFITVGDLAKGEPIIGAKEISIPAFLKLTGPVNPGQVVTPLAVAQNLDGSATESLGICQRLRETTPTMSPELRGLVSDIEAMDWMGRYYADKIRGATRLAQFRQSGDPAHKAAAVAALENALKSWQNYAQLASSQYRPQDLARGGMLDWHALTKDVEKELATVRAAKPGAAAATKEPKAKGRAGAAADAAADAE